MRARLRGLLRSLLLSWMSLLAAVLGASAVFGLAGYLNVSAGAQLGLGLAVLLGVLALRYRPTWVLLRVALRGYRRVVRRMVASAGDLAGRWLLWGLMVLAIVVFELAHLRAMPAGLGIACVALAPLVLPVVVGGWDLVGSAWARILGGQWPAARSVGLSASAPLALVLFILWFVYPSVLQSLPIAWWVLARYHPFPGPELVALLAPNALGLALAAVLWIVDLDRRMLAQFAAARAGLDTLRRSQPARSQGARTLRWMATSGHYFQAAMAVLVLAVTLPMLAGVFCAALYAKSKVVT